MENLLNDYLDKKIELHPTMNIHQFSFYDTIGEYLYKNLKEKEISDQQVKFYMMMASEKNYDKGQLTIMFESEFLNESSLQKMFGEPIRHSHFGEGFEDYDSETESYSGRDYEFASYMVTINDKIHHIGYDHRGTSIETTVTDVDELEEFYKKLVDLYVKSL